MSFRRVAVVGVIGCVLFTACSSEGGSDATSSPSRSSARSSNPTSSSTSTAPSQPPVSAVPEAGGWRLALTAPRAGSKVGRAVRLCYELTGTSREPDAELEVRVRVGTRSETTSVPAMVGRGSTTVALPSGTGEGSVTIQLRAEGREIPGVRFEVPVRFVDGPGTAACP